MDIYDTIARFQIPDTIVCIGMHTTGEPTRIVVRGIDHLLTGRRLLDKRDDAKVKHDHLRKRIMLEPRGHSEMYGAILIRDTELVRSGEADVGVLFTHNEGYSTMCGHATLALGRLLIDSADADLFPNRSKLTHDPSTGTTTVNLHAPCGLVAISVPTTISQQGIKYDPSRLVSFVSVPCFATAIDLVVEIPDAYRWPELASRTEINLDVAYGGAFYVIVDACELGFSSGLRDARLEDLSRASLKVKTLLADLYPYTTLHPTEPALSYLYGVVVVDKTLSQHETGLCFFADQQVDRSPTGSAVGARVALAYAKGTLGLYQPRLYHSLVSLTSSEPESDAFRGEAVEVVAIEGGQGCSATGVRVKTGGRAFYTDAAAFVAEPTDSLSAAGFQVKLPTSDGC